jgi:uncharacterized protein YcbK (DUF882 family)
MRLTAHFDSREFASRDGVPAPARQLHWLRRLCRRYLEPLRQEFGVVVVHSGFRTSKHNDNVGGAPGSFHLRIPHRRGAAADVSCARGTPRDWYEFLDRLGAPGLGLYDTHVHVDNRRGRARW